MEENHDLEGMELSIDRVWHHPIECGLLIKNLPPRVTEDILETYLEAQDDVSTKRITIAPDEQSATVELTDTLSKYLNYCSLSGYIGVQYCYRATVAM